MSSIWRPVRERNPARSLMVIVAHPGDEAFGFGGAIATAAASGAYVVIVCATRGWFDSRLLGKPPAPGGKNRDVKTGALIWRNLDSVREDELRRSVAVLGVRVVRQLDLAEGDLDRIDFDHLVGRLVQPIRMHRPEVILTFGPEGVTGDPDHVVLSRAATLAYDRAAEPLAYEADIEEDQVAWRAAKLYHLVVPESVVRLHGQRMPDEAYGSPDGAATLSLDLGDASALKLAAITRHVSQTGSAGPFDDWAPEVRDAWLATEHYRLVRSALPMGCESGGNRRAPRERDLGQAVEERRLLALAIPVALAAGGGGSVGSLVVAAVAGAMLAVAIRVERLDDPVTSWRPAWRALKQALYLAGIGPLLVGVYAGLDVGVLIIGAFGATIAVLAIPGARRQRSRQPPLGTEWVQARLADGRGTCGRLTFSVPDGWVAWTAEHGTIVLVPAKTRFNVPIPAIGIGTMDLGEHSADEAVDDLLAELGRSDLPVRISNLRRSTGALRGEPAIVLDADVHLRPELLGLPGTLARVALWALGAGSANSLVMLTEAEGATYAVGFVAWQRNRKRVMAALDSVTSSIRWE